MGLFDLLGSSATDSLEHVIGFTSERHKVFANNVANVDTPGYRMRDLAVAKFDRALTDALRKSKTTNPNVARLDLPTVEELDHAGGVDPAYAERLRGIVFHDDNDRSMEGLMIEMTKNADRHAQAAGLLRSQIRLLRSIISETPQ